MSDELRSVTIIIPTRPDQAEVSAVRAGERLEYPSDRLEIIIARGRQPACQRNAALREARGELVYFLDDDSKPEPGNVRRALAHFREAGVEMVGGPSLCPSDAPPLEQVFAVVLASWLAFGPSRARYDQVGPVRETSEKELILCNLMARRQALLDLGGFDEALYPNEENALMDDLQKQGAKLIYDPAFVVQRRPRPTVRAFARMLMTYGRGRAEQFRRHPTLGSALNFVPPLFVLYLVVAPWIGVMALGPLGFYAVAVAVQGAVSARRFGLVRGLAAVPGVILTHLLYGLGFWRGLFTRLGQDTTRLSTEVTLEKINPLSCAH
jgi:succinoglycan biosynthesis protein ExoA